MLIKVFYSLFSLAKSYIEILKQKEPEHQTSLKAKEVKKMFAESNTFKKVSANNKSINNSKI